MGGCFSVCFGEPEEEKKRLILNDDKFSKNSILTPRGGGSRDLKTRPPIGSVSLGLDMSGRKEVMKQGLMRRLKTKKNLTSDSKLDQKDQTITEFFETEVIYFGELKALLDDLC
jgi:hypothetical protein